MPLVFNNCQNGTKLLSNLQPLGKWENRVKKMWSKIFVRRLLYVRRINRKDKDTCNKLVMSSKPKWSPLFSSLWSLGCHKERIGCGRAPIYTSRVGKGCIWKYKNIPRKIYFWIESRNRAKFYKIDLDQR